MADASPILFDDGGSTRIRQIKDNVNMDKLLGVTAGGVTTFQDTAADPFVNGAGAFRCNMKIRYHEKDGSHHILPDNPVPGGPAGKDLAPGDTVTINSQNGQVVTLTFDAASRLVVTLTASAAGVDPIVEAKQTNQQRRYIVTNAGPIWTISHTRAGVTTQFFDNGATPSIYTMLHLH